MSRGQQPPRASLPVWPVHTHPHRGSPAQGRGAHPVGPQAFDLLAFLSANPDRLLTKTELMRAVWSDAVVEESNLAYTVFAIRKVLGESPEADLYIETVPKRGYRFIVPVVRMNGDDLPGSRRTASDFNVPQASAQLDAQGVSPTGRPALSGPRRRTPGRIRHVLDIPRRASLGVWGRRTRRQPASLGENDEPARALRAAGTEVFTILPPMFWSPDSRFIAFQAGGHVKVVSPSGGAPRRCAKCRAPPLVDPGAETM